MYILELIAKLIEKEKYGKTQKVEQQDTEELCNHSFFPIDSTGEILACSKCGLVIHNEKLVVKPKNPFS